MKEYTVTGEQRSGLGARRKTPLSFGRHGKAEGHTGAAQLGTLWTEMWHLSSGEPCG